VRPPGDSHPSQLTALGHRYRDSLTVHHLTREATPGTLSDPSRGRGSRPSVEGMPVQRPAGRLR